MILFKDKGFLPPLTPAESLEKSRLTEPLAHRAPLRESESPGDMLSSARNSIAGTWDSVARTTRKAWHQSEFVEELWEPEISVCVPLQEIFKNTLWLFRHSGLHVVERDGHVTLEHAHADESWNEHQWELLRILEYLGEFFETAIFRYCPHQSYDEATQSVVYTGHLVPSTSVLKELRKFSGAARHRPCIKVCGARYNGSGAYSEGGEIHNPLERDYEE